MKKEQLKDELKDELIQAYKEKCEALKSKCNMLEALVRLHEVTDRLNEMQIDELKKANKKLNSLVEDMLAVKKAEEIRKAFEGPTSL